MKSIATDICIFALSLLLLAGCGAEQKALGDALELAGENGVELRRVLEHYRDDPRKLEAARYLIRNMPGHHQKYGDAVDRGKDLLARADSSRGYMPDSPEKREVEAALGSLHRVSDISAITSRMLIENIDMAFMAWEENPWKDEYSIEEFCEWVLPYRVGDVEEDVVFQTVVAGRNGLEPAGFPFMIHGGKVRMFTPDTCVRETAALTRKYPLQAHILKYMSWMTGGRITGSRTGNFWDELPICNVSDTPRMQMNWLRAVRRGPFRAVRFYPPDGYRTEVAQLEVYSSGRRMVPEKVEGAAPHHGDPASGASSAVDGDWSTFYYSHEPNGVLELAFGSAATVAGMRRGNMGFKYLP